MAITKLPRSGIADDAINADKIEDGTIQATEITGTVSAVKLNDTLDISSNTVTLPNTSVTSDMLAGSIANAKLSNSTFTVRGTSRALGVSFSLGVDVDWQSVVTGDTTMVAGQGYFVNTTSGAVTMTLPSSASTGDTIAIKDYAGTFGSNAVTIARNSHKIQGLDNNSSIETNRASIVLVYADATKGWLYTDEHNVANLESPTFTSATGGTVATSGDFKIHTFTGDGCFVVTAGNVGTFPGNPLAGPAKVDYLVIAGGGGGNGSSGGGGGAGGMRSNYPNPDSPTGGAFTITSQTYPISVGAGGPSTTPQGGQGSNSIFATITSTGGGGGSGPGQTGGNGGSGGGGGNSKGPYPAPTANTFVAGGSGNTPPVSPSQGSNGGQGGWPGQQGGGGGGKGGAGAGAPGSYPAPNGPRVGGNGEANSITGSSVTYAGGGGAGGNFGYQGGPAVGGPTSPATSRTGGPGGGGNGGGGPSEPDSNNYSGTAGTANLGGGGGGRGGAGGKGVVILRYKFQ